MSKTLEFKPLQPRLYYEIIKNGQTKGKLINNGSVWVIQNGFAGDLTQADLKQLVEFTEKLG